MALLKNKKVWIMFAFTAFYLFIYRLGNFITVPMIDLESIKSIFGEQQMFGFLDIFTGGALSNFSILALGISPYITASIVTQLLQMDIVPKFKEWAEEGEAGREKLNQITRYLALFLAFVQALTITIGISTSYYNIPFVASVTPNAMIYTFLAIVMTAGTGFVLWLSEKLTKRGVGNGTSMLIVAGIVSSFPTMISDLMNTYIINQTTTDASGNTVATNPSAGNIAIFCTVIVVMILIILLIAFMESAQRKIPVQYANRPGSSSFAGKNESNVPIKLNSASVIPVIFAATLMSLPTTISSFLNAGTSVKWVTMVFDTAQPIGFALYIILIFVFSFFYSFLQMDPTKMAENLNNNHSYIPGQKPGDATASYLSRVLFKITMVGATYLAFVAAIPIVMSAIFDLPSSVSVGGTSIIIVVGVAIETWKQLKDEQSKEKKVRGFLD